MSNQRWTLEQARNWYAAQPPILGCNFLPRTAINQLEMFQPEDYDKHLPVLERELSWAAELGMNSLRVFLHDLLWEHHGAEFYRRFDHFLDLCTARGIRPMVVFFDACHRPEPRPGTQPAPTPGLHNPGWAQSPAVSKLMDPSGWDELERYVMDVIERYRDDARILAWDLYNEPCNAGFDGNAEKAEACVRLLGEVFRWARSVSPSQPLTVCSWASPNPLRVHDGQVAAMNDYQRALHRAQLTALQESDIISFHHYGGPADLADEIDLLSTLQRPVLCTEYMARTHGSTFHNALPILREKHVGAYNWGFVAGKSQTIFPWGSVENAEEPEMWFHDILRPDGTPFDTEETELIRKFAT